MMTCPAEIGYNLRHLAKASRPQPSSKSCSGVSFRRNNGIAGSGAVGIP